MSQDRTRPQRRGAASHRTTQGERHTARRQRREAQLAAVPTELRADMLRERVYVTFTALAVVLTLGSHPHDVGPGEAMASIAITTIGTVLAAFTAELVAHVAVHGQWPARPLLRAMERVSLGAASVIALPLLCLVLAATGHWEVATSLSVASGTLLVALAAIGWLAVRRTAMPWWQKGAALTVLVALGAAVVALKTLAH